MSAHMSSDFSKSIMAKSENIIGTLKKPLEKDELNETILFFENFDKDSQAQTKLNESSEVVIRLREREEEYKRILRNLPNKRQDVLVGKVSGEESPDDIYKVTDTESDLSKEYQVVKGQGVDSKKDTYHIVGGQQ
jgi:hypothetical protein